MDPAVLESIKKWPNVPAVYGWMSLSARGEWLLHPQMQSKGEPIGNEQIRAFVQRNYGVNSNGAAYFQNGPQTVFVHLESTPWVAQIEGQSDVLITQTRSPIDSISTWYLIDEKLYFHFELGIASVDDRDLESFIERLHGRLKHSNEGIQGENLLECLLTTPEKIESLALPSWNLTFAPLELPLGLQKNISPQQVAYILGFTLTPKKVL